MSAEVNETAALYRTMLAKVRSLMLNEARLSDKLKSAQQWQLLFQIDGMDIIVGKGGINTMFYILGTGGKRVICYPDELVDKIKKWSQRKYTAYIVYDKDGNGLAGPSMKKIRDTDFPTRSYQSGFYNGKEVKLAVLQKSLTGRAWVPVKTNHH